MAKQKPSASTTAQKNHFSLKEIEPLTENQKKAFNFYQKGQNLILSGSAGSGKSFLAVYLCLNDLLEERSDYEKIVIIRSAVQSRNLGFTPGSVEEKAKVYEAPYKGIVDELFGRGDAYDVLRQKNIIEFHTTSFLRGKSYNNSLLILDEMQNCTFQELDTVITRVGKNTRIVFCGDYKQTDLNGKFDKSGIQDFINIVNRMKSFSHVNFVIDDVVRSGIVKEYLIASEEYDNYKMKNEIST